MAWRHIPLFFSVVVATFVIHEGGHWAAGELLGYDMWVRLNSAGLARGAFSAEWHQQFVSAAGPVVTLIQAAIAYLLVVKRKTNTAFAFVFSALMMRIMAAFVSIGNPNDEARVGEWLGVGPWTLHILVVLLLLSLTLRAGSRLELGWRDYGLAWFAVSLGIAAVVLGEPMLPTLNPYG
ncbi:hypothetical protein ABI59_09460 [Acidobacteria bacterium Mor1]|nr:hypothetical protein ABI59_09460 [Acidobacteria bacterium Mor1]